MDYSFYELKLWWQMFLASKLEPLLLIVLLFVLGAAAVKIALKIARKLLLKSELDPALHRFVFSAIRVVLWAIVLITVLDVMGIPATSVLTVFAAAGAAVALALKDSLSNVAGGIIIMFTKPFVRGDYIETADISGMVDSIDLLYTKVNTYDGKAITVPNGQITTSTVINYSREENRRVDIFVHIPYSSNLDTARDALFSLSASEPLILKEPEPFCAVDAFDSNGLRLVLRVWCLNENYWAVKYNLQNSVKDTLSQAGIEIPFPQLDINIPVCSANSGKRHPSIQSSGGNNFEDKHE